MATELHNVIIATVPTAFFNYNYHLPLCGKILTMPNG